MGGHHRLGDSCHSLPWAKRGMVLGVKVLPAKEDTRRFRVASLAFPGLDELRWPAPVRPGDSLRLRTTILEARRSRSKPDSGLVRLGPSCSTSTIRPSSA
jgi:acyl dehydratase